MPRQFLHQAINLLLGVVEMRRAAQASFADGDLDAVLFPQADHDLLVVVLGRNEADDAAPLPFVARLMIW